MLDLGERGRCRADAAGSALRPRLYHRHPPARADRAPDPGGQRPRQRPQRARKGLRARLRALHAADAGHARRSTKRAPSSPTHGEIVVKPLHGNGGKAIFKVGADGANLSALIEVFNTAYREPHMIQAFLPDVAKGDKRIVLVDGEVAGAINRVPGEGEIRSNLAVGGSAEKTELTPARAGNLRRARPRTASAADCCSSAST